MLISHMQFCLVYSDPSPLQISNLLTVPVMHARDPLGNFIAKLILSILDNLFFAPITTAASERCNVPSTIATNTFYFFINAGDKPYPTEFCIRSNKEKPREIL